MLSCSANEDISSTVEDMSLRIQPHECLKKVDDQLIQKRTTIIVYNHVFPLIYITVYNCTLSYIVTVDLYTI